MSSTLQRKKVNKADRSAEFASYAHKPVRARMANSEDFKAVKIENVKQKTPVRVQQKIRDSARGEDCLVRITGACTGNPEHTIWSHAPLHSAGKGMGIKAVDVAGAYCCTACDAVVDGQAPMPPGATRQSVLLDWCYGHLRSLLKLKQKGLV